MAKDEILVIGDAMLDVYYEGTADRLSPEAPVPVVQVQNVHYAPGGAANVANNIKSLGSDCCLVTVLGNDREADILENLLEQKSVRSKVFREPNTFTTIKSRVVAKRQQIVRFDRDGGGGNEVKFLPWIKQELSGFQGGFIVISDYGKGVTSPALLNQIMGVASKKGAKVLVDPKDGDWDKYKGAYLMKPNLSELEKAVGHTIPNKSSDIETASRKALLKWELDYILTTRGEKGMLLVSKDNAHPFENNALDVFDVSGAGDTVLATLVHFLRKGKSLLESCSKANRAGGIIVSKFGTATITEKEIITS